MALIDDVKVVCDRIAPLGWRDLLMRVTGGLLDIQQPTAKDLRTALRAKLMVDRNVLGFTDFAVGGECGIEPGLPGRSLLYHALASSSVHEGLSGFPTEKELECVENYVFAASPPTLAQLRQRAGLAAGQKFSVVVFACEYRPARDTCSRLQADLAFSRTGVARVGTHPPEYDSRHRGYRAEVASDAFGFHVCPARYVAYLAVPRKGALGRQMRPQSGDANQDFWMPVHKLFGGRECIKGLNLTVAFSAFHYNDKIRRTRSITLGLPNVPTHSPYQYSDGIAEIDAQGRVVPVPHARFVEEAKDGGAFLTFAVKPSASVFAALEPRGRIDPDTQAEVRPAPAYVHVRTQVKNGALIDLNADASRPDVLQTVSQGGYDALHYRDFTGDGQVDVAVQGLDGASGDVTLPGVTAYSLVAAPDFFPSAGQREMFERAPIDSWGVPPEPLCDTRLPANLQMPGNRFVKTDRTVTAVVPLLAAIAAGTTRPVSHDCIRHSCLPDDCAGVYAPGWDVSTDKLRIAGADVQHLAAYGLGSPFPEDAKLCAALSTFWPAVAPDASRGMSPHPNPNLQATVAPLTDEEIGQVGLLPWDGVTGPKIVNINGTDFAECADFMHVDYVQEALEGRFSLRLTARVGSDEFAQRMTAISRVYRVLGGDRNDHLVLSFRVPSFGDTELQKAQQDVGAVFAGPGVYRIETIAGGIGAVADHPSNHRRKLLRLTARRFFFVALGSGVVAQRRSTQSLWTRA
ncbi:hypothetical protein PV762_04630 [Mitsuaria sp. CC2]|uniref:hypothetical protein n=1 Tax=Mitsuaria sp. CC2 TaxID=3029186 RepID=UPI003B8D50BD